MSAVADPPEVATATPDNPTADEARCEAMTEAGGTVYQCGLTEGHDGEHAFSAVDETDTATASDDAEGDDAEQDATVNVQEREKKLKSEATRHENALKKIWGDDFDTHAFCAVCLGEGFVTPWVPGSFPDDAWEMVKLLCGRIDEDELEHPDNYVVCPTCQGWCEIATGAKAQHAQKIPCPDCESRGWFNTKDAHHRVKLGLEPLAAPQSPPPVFAAPYAPPASPEPNGGLPVPPAGWATSAKIGADDWGRWPGHPRHGIDPSLGGGW